VGTAHQTVASWHLQYGVPIILGKGCIEGNLRPEGFKIGNSGLKWQKPQRLVETVRFLIAESNPIKGLRMLAVDYR